ncbi:Holliday junction resolvase RuvX [Engelhardtia mirabilis]|uniref:Holliday junction resolvase RuvX n=1 Tax=Engelhardtia mirabilis TaxID=2528011 RepID=UPI003AF3630C
MDHGASKTGLAACDALRITTRVLETARLDGDAPGLVEHVAELADERDAATVLIGLPRLASGDEGARAVPTRAFAGRLASRLADRQVLLYDESLTTKAAEERMRDDDVPRERRRELRDSYAALVLLEDWLEGGGVGGERVRADAEAER